MNSKKAEKIAKALADPNRLTILKELRKQKDCVYCIDLNDLLDLSQPSISHHMKLLTDAELILTSKEGRNVKYKLNDQVMDDYIQFLESLRK